MYQLRPISSRLIGRLSGRPLTDHAIERRELGGATSWPVAPVVMLPDEMDRVVRHHLDSKPALNLDYVTATAIQQGPTRAHAIEDVVIADGSLLAPGGYSVLRPESRRKWLGGSIPSIDTAVMCSTSMTERYFAHWLQDGFTHELLADRIGAPAIVLPPVPRAHEPGYRALFDRPARPVAIARVAKLWLIDDAEVNAGRKSRLDQLRQRLRDKTSADGPSHVFLSRGTSGRGRILANERDICNALQQRGFAIVEPEKSNVEDIAYALRSAQLIVAVEGSALAHAAMAAPENARLMIIQPPRHFNMLYRMWAGVLGMRFGFTVADVVDEENFAQPTDRLLRAIDLLEQA